MMVYVYLVYYSGGFVYKNVMVPDFYMINVIEIKKITNVFRIKQDVLSVYSKRLYSNMKSPLLDRTEELFEWTLGSFGSCNDFHDFVRRFWVEQCLDCNFSNLIS